MRIVGGKHRGRRLLTPQTGDIRPTSDRARESLFNILAHGGWTLDDGSDDGTSQVIDAVVLDAFCGTGALGLEALSRGAATAIFLDSARASLDLAKANAASLRETDTCRFVVGDATRPPAPPPGLQAQLLLMDPPYGKGLAGTALAGLSAAGWLAPKALAVVEVGSSDPDPTAPGFTTLDDRRYGKSRLVFLRAP